MIIVAIALNFPRLPCRFRDDFISPKFARLEARSAAPRDPPASLSSSPHVQSHPGTQPRGWHLTWDGLPKMIIKWSSNDNTWKISMAVQWISSGDFYGDFPRWRWRLRRLKPSPCQIAVDGRLLNMLGRASAGIPALGSVAFENWLVMTWWCGIIMDYPAKGMVSNSKWLPKSPPQLGSHGYIWQIGRLRHCAASWQPETGRFLCPRSSVHLVIETSEMINGRSLPTI